MPTRVILPLIRRVMPNIIAADIMGVQDMSAGPKQDPRFYREGFEQLSELTFAIYRGGEDARQWLEETPLNCGILREWLEKVDNIFTMKVRYPGSTMGTDRYEAWTVTFHDAGEAALFKLTWL